MNPVEEEVMKALDFEVLGRIPRYDSFWTEFAEKCKEELVLGPDAVLEDYFDIDIAIASADGTPFPSAARVLGTQDGYCVRRDGWGRIIRERPGAYFSEIVRTAVPDGTDPDSVAFEPAQRDERFHDFLRSVETDRFKRCVFAKIGGPFMCTAFLRGEEAFLADMASDPGFARSLIHKVAAHLLSIGKESLRRGGLYGTGIWIYDDMACNQGPMMSPKTFEKLFLPVYACMIAELKACGSAKVCLHSDGNIEPLLDMLVGAGVDAIHPVEPRVGLSMRLLRERFGRRLALIGGMCNSDVLPNGPADRIKRETRDIIELAREGGIIIGSHSIGPDVPVSHYLAYDEVVRNEGVFTR